MSAISVIKGLEVPELPGNSFEAMSYTASDGGVTRGGRSLRQLISLAGWRRQILETLLFLGVIAVLQRRLFGAEEIPGLPHPYCIPVLLASCQYGMGGGFIATVAASVAYFIGLSPQSAAQDFYDYAGTVAIQPAAWLATALVVGGLRNLHIHQYAELANQFAVSGRRASDLSQGLERAAAEINALERRIAVDMSSVAALSRSLSLIDMSDRPAAAMSFGELFRVGAGAATFTIFLKDRDGYLPVWAVENDIPHSVKSTAPLPFTAIESMMNESANRAAEVIESKPGAGRYVVSVPPSHVGAKPPLAAIVCELQTSQDLRQFRRRAEDLGRLFATILYACPSPLSETRS